MQSPKVSVLPAIGSAGKAKPKPYENIVFVLGGPGSGKVYMI
jgi:chromosomal replication initiation ATPase DnaA